MFGDGSDFTGTAVRSGGVAVIVSDTPSFLALKAVIADSQLTVLFFEKQNGIYPVAYILLMTLVHLSLHLRLVHITDSVWPICIQSHHRKWGDHQSHDH